MTFDSEWAAMLSDAQERQTTTRLNQLAPDPGGSGSGGGGAPDLMVAQDDLGAVGSEAFRAHDQLRKRADIAGAGSGRSSSGSTAQAAKECSDHRLAMGDELLVTLSLWDTQVKTVLQMCAHISNHLNYTKKSHANEEAEIEASLRHRNGTAVPVSDIVRLIK
ncbi:hypothetical protein [Streptomyces albipurpureus]|uniref:Uncharacterized protein n=1 Tax=Streptomyces albipurpureus TaxID=2897419 RepID=A0ABT0UV78_9ACTN|nr:hypothetical protein [Streptomyces sp. CWNU-1]MCM2391268.1 hypothetical protein [Streptomyces sp. CWNU-1]